MSVGAVSFNKKLKNSRIPEPLISSRTTLERHAANFHQPVQFPLFHLDLFFFIEILATIYDFFFQAEDGIRDLIVTGVQTCALPIFTRLHDLAALNVAPVAEPCELAV